MDKLSKGTGLEATKGLDRGRTGDGHAEIPALGLRFLQEPLAETAPGRGAQAGKAQSGTFSLHPDDLGAGINGGGTGCIGAVESEAEMSGGALLEDGGADQRHTPDADVVDLTGNTGT